jgi:Ricin-type beta-trefoil lectin domain-like/Right handed beta helix region
MNAHRVVLRRVLAIGTITTMFGTTVVANVSAVGAAAIGINNGTTYEIINGCAGQALDVAGLSQEDGASVLVWDRYGNANQKWTVDGAGPFALHPTHAPSKSLDVAGAQNYEGSTVWQYATNGTNAQQWSAQDLGNGKVRLISSVGAKALQVKGGATNSPVEIASPATSCAQEWTFVPVGGIPPTTAPPTTTPPTTTPTAGVLYVATNGSSAGNGSSARPFKTPQEAVDVAKSGDTIIVRSGTYNLTSMVMIKDKQNITLKAERPVTLIDDSAPVGQGPTFAHGTIRVDNADGTTVTGFRIENSPFFGIRVSDSQNVSIIENVTRVTLASSIYGINVSGIRIIGNDASRFCDQGSYPIGLGCQEGISISVGKRPNPTPEQALRDATDGFEISNNKVHDAPMLGKTNPLQTAGGGEGINVKEGSKNGVVRNNEVYNLVQNGIYIDSYIEGVSNVEVSGNVVHDTSGGIALAAEEGGLLTNIRVFNNVSYRNGLGGIGITGNSDDGPKTNIQIYNNTIYRNGLPESKPAWAGGVGTLDPKIDPTQNFYGAGIGNGSQNSSGVVFRDNVLYLNTNIDIPVELFTTKGTEVVNNFVGDPQFVSAETGDFRLRPGSPAAGRGAFP